MTLMRSLLAAIVVLLGVARVHAIPLPSWNDGPSRTAILAFVDAVTKEGGPDFVPPAERIAVFDNDGTLWVEKPIYVQAAFAFDRVKALAPQHPEWRTTPPFDDLLAGDLKAFAATGIKGVEEVVMATHADMTTGAFTGLVTDWIATARHPRFKRPYPECIYQPMVELLEHLRARGFQTFIVSGGGVDFMRPWTDGAYGIPPEQVVGSSIVTEFRMGADGKPELYRLPRTDFVDDGPGKPVGIHKFIGQRPIFAFGNSDGDLQMLQWTAAGGGKRFMGLVHHTDAVREWAYDRDSAEGRLDKALDEARARGWTVVDMKAEWKRIFPFDEAAK